MTTKHPGVMKGFSEDNGVIYGGMTRSALDKAVELIGNEYINEEGKIARRFAEKYSWDVVVDEFEGVLEDVIRGE